MKDGERGRKRMTLGFNLFSHKFQNLEIPVYKFNYARILDRKNIYKIQLVKIFEIWEFNSFGWSYEVI